jgi:pimeloyl-ACP methyl ester carboxylesterase
MPRLSVADAIADRDAVITDLGLGECILAGFSLGGWAALHYAATRPCRALVCLDGPTNLDYEAMGLRPSHPGFVPDPPDVPADFASLPRPAIVVLCGGESPTMRSGWSPPAPRWRSLITALPDIQVQWLQTSHMVVLSKANQARDSQARLLVPRTFGTETGLRRRRQHFSFGSAEGGSGSRSVGSSGGDDAGAEASPRIGSCFCARDVAWHGHAVLDDRLALIDYIRGAP